MRYAAILLLVLFSHAALAQEHGDDERAWAEALATDNLAGYRSYLNRFPSGVNATMAFRCTIELRLLPDANGCSAVDAPPGPLGPVSSQTGKFAIEIL